MRVISIIVPVYNVEKYIHRCINSILAQTYADFELILVDDGSSDQCGKICDEYAQRDDRINVIHQENNGVSSARNAGLCISKGEFITFCDSDDEIEPDYLLNLITESDLYDLVISGFKYVNQSGNIIGVNSLDNHEYNNIDYSVVLNLFGNFLLSNVWGKRLKRSIIEHNQIQFCNSLDFAEDTLFICEYILHSKSVLVISDTTYCYRKHSNSTLNSYNASLYRRSLDADSRILTVLEQRFPGFESSVHWKMREWPILRKCLFGTLNNNEETIYEKKKTIGSILKNKAFPRTKAEIEQMLPHEGYMIKIILLFRSATLLLLFYRAYRLRNRLTGRL